MTRADIENNPFLVLGIPTTATRQELERAGQKLLAQLELGVAAASTYQTPFGPRPRDASHVRAALAALRDPERRLRAEVWAVTDAKADTPAPPLPAWTQAFASIGWRKPWA